MNLKKAGTLALVAMLGLGLAFANTAEASVPAAYQEASDRIEAATVNIYCTFKKGRKLYSSSGSGVFVSERGVILTNAHVAQALLVAKNAKAKGDCSIRTGSPARAEYKASLLYLSPDWVSVHIAELKKKDPRGTGEGDFALLYVTEATKGSLPERFPALPLHTGELTAFNELEPVLAAGYPAEHLDYKDVQKRLAFLADDTTVSGVRSFTRPWTDMLVLAPSKAGSGGVSGGPVARLTGDLIAINTAVESDDRKEERSLRAITLSHIERSLLAESGTSLYNILHEDLENRSRATYDAFSAKLMRSVSSAMFAKKK